MICVHREILLLNHSSFYPLLFWRKMILVWEVCWYLTVLSFLCFCLKALDFGRYWENSPIGWGGLTLQPGRTSETGRRSLINRITFKNAEVICTWQPQAPESMKIKNCFTERFYLAQRLPLWNFYAYPHRVFYGATRFMFVVFSFSLLRWGK